MRVKHWLIGCAICFAGIGGAAATAADNRELDSAARGAGDSSGMHDGGNDTVGPPRDGAPRTTGGDSRKGPSRSTGTEHSGTDMTPPARAQQAHLGWQSLLPGSIQ